MATRCLSVEIDLLESPLYDCWVQDIGPSFVAGAPDLNAQHAPVNDHR
ncbi:hypothetical protein [Cryobacterium sp. Y11]|nr:hypothetical protein [Cryobacterium sp. Y11]